jgi:hypothetical protein
MIALFAVLLMMPGCEQDQTAKLEKQNQELKAQLKAESEKSTAIADYDLQAKCSKDATAWFNSNWAPSNNDKTTMLLNFTNHYNKSLNKCFILVEYHVSTQEKTTSWIGDISLYDVYENARYGDFSQNHALAYEPTFYSDEQVFTCEVSNQKCKTIDEYNGLVRPYMNN